MDDIRIGLAGLGHRAYSWIKNFERVGNYRVTAISDPIEALHEPFLDALGYRDGVKVYSNYDDMLADDNVDAVALCVRCKEQGALAAEALEAGKHVNSEVPAAHTVEDCWHIVLAAERSGKLYHLAEQTRFWGFIEAWKHLVAEGTLGKITYCEGQYIGFYGTRQFFQNVRTGDYVDIEEYEKDPDVKPRWSALHPPIHYLPHELSPMLKVLDDRVVEVTAMGTKPPSRAYPRVPRPDIQVALMKTEKDTVLRMATGFTQPVPHRDHHWYQLIGTKGCVEWRRSKRELCKMWLADMQMHDVAEVDWRMEREDAMRGAKGSGHGDADYYVHASFRDALLHGTTPELDVYAAMDTAAPAILAAESIDQGTKLMKVPDFRPSDARPAGQAPKEMI